MALVAPSHSQVGETLSRVGSTKPFSITPRHLAKHSNLDLKSYAARASGGEGKQIPWPPPPSEDSCLPPLCEVRIDYHGRQTKIRN